MIGATFRTTTRSAALLGSLLLARPSLAGPPYVTDDPEPVPLRNWELYVTGARTSDGGQLSGDSHLEANYGFAKGLQLHVVVPVSFARPGGGGTTYGLGDVEVGAKVRFLEETDDRPQAGVFPLVELPTGATDRGLGAGHVRAFLPVWVQKSFGRLTTYGGGGYWLNPGDGNRNWWFAGWQAQVQATSFLSPGVEVYYQSPSQEGRSDEVHVNAGLIFDFGENHHVLVSAGRGVHGCGCSQAYAAYLLTLGPKTEAP